MVFGTKDRKLTEDGHLEAGDHMNEQVTAHYDELETTCVGSSPWKGTIKFNVIINHLKSICPDMLTWTIERNGQSSLIFL